MKAHEKFPVCCFFSIGLFDISHIGSLFVLFNVYHLMSIIE
jgi:hypothetical protein